MPKITRREIILGSVTSSVALFLAKPSFADTNSSTEDALTVLSSDTRFTFWVQALKSCGLAQYAAGPDQFTAFVPTNHAFSRYPNILAAVLRPNTNIALEQTRSVSAFIKAHIIPGRHTLSDFAGNVSTVTSMAGTPITIDASHSTPYSVTWVSDDWRSATSQLTIAPLIASNAIIYPVDDVTLI